MQYELECFLIRFWFKMIENTSVLNMHIGPKWSLSLEKVDLVGSCMSFSSPEIR